MAGEQDEKRIFELLKKLEVTEEFQKWRDEVAKPLLEQWEAKLQDAKNLSEVELRATLMHFYTIKALFYTFFETARIQQDTTEEVAKEVNN